MTTPVPESQVPSIPLAELPEQLPENSALLDVRESAEWQAGHAPRAVRIPMRALLTWDGSIGNMTPPVPESQVPRIPLAELSAQLPENSALLDVRENGEWQAGHAPGAVHIPMGELP